MNKTVSKTLMKGQVTKIRGGYVAYVIAGAEVFGPLMLKVLATPQEAWKLIDDYFIDYQIMEVL